MTQEPDTTPSTATDDEQPASEDDRIEFVATLALALGLGALGFGTGLHVSLMSVQAAAVETGRLSLEAQVGADLSRVLLDLQAWANIALYAAGVLLVGGALLSDRQHVKRRFQALVTRLDTEDDTEEVDPDA